jgi:DNA-binding transcriptional regulator GbsR (MarR family)
MAETKKLTKKDYFKMLKELVGDRPELVSFIDHEIELLTNKASKSSQTKTQKENETIKEVIVATLTELGRYVSISEIQDANETLGALSNQKISALLKQLVDGGIVKKQIDKKKAYFSV